MATPTLRPIVGNRTKYAVANAGTAIGSFTSAIEVYSFGLKKTATHEKNPGMRGTRSMHKEGVREGSYTCAGVVSVPVTPANLDIWLPKILGAAESNDVFAVTEQLSDREFAILVDLDPDDTTNPRRHLYDGCYVNKATFKSSGSANGGLLMLDLDILAKTRTESTTAFPSITIGTTDVNDPYQHADIGTGLTLDSDTYSPTEIEIIIDNMLEAQWRGAKSAGSIIAKDRIVTFSPTMQLGNNELYGLAVAGIAGTLTYTVGDYSIEFDFANLKAPDEGFDIPGRDQEVPLRLNFTAYQSSTTKEIICTNVNTSE